jgi:hypothetical protein
MSMLVSGRTSKGASRKKKASKQPTQSRVPPWAVGQPVTAKVRGAVPEIQDKVPTVGLKRISSEPVTPISRIEGEDISEERVVRPNDTSEGPSRIAEVSGQGPVSVSVSGSLTPHFRMLEQDMSRECEALRSPQLSEDNLGEEGDPNIFEEARERQHPSYPSEVERLATEAGDNPNPDPAVVRGSEGDAPTLEERGPSQPRVKSLAKHKGREFAGEGSEDEARKRLHVEYDDDNFIQDRVLEMAQLFAPPPFECPESAALGLAESSARNEIVHPSSPEDLHGDHSEEDHAGPSRIPRTQFIWENLLGCPLEAISKVIPKGFAMKSGRTNARECAKALLRAELTV